MGLPAGSHCVRLCSQTALGDEGEVTVNCFSPHVGTDERAADRYLSVHWLEYFGHGSFSECLKKLRAFLLNSQVPRERKPTTNGKLAVLPCDQLILMAQQEVQIEIQVHHEPRVANVATSIEVSPEGEIRYGIAPQQALTLGLNLDPHSGIHTLPEAAAHQLAVQQYLVSNVVYVEPGRIPT